jgi:hypothetical protein
LFKTCVDGNKLDVFQLQRLHDLSAIAWQSVAVDYAARSNQGFFAGAVQHGFSFASFIILINPKNTTYGEKQ